MVEWVMSSSRRGNRSTKKPRCVNSSLVGKEQTQGGGIRDPARTALRGLALTALPMGMPTSARSASRKRPPPLTRFGHERGDSHPGLNGIPESHVTGDETGSSPTRSTTSLASAPGADTAQGCRSSWAFLRSPAGRRGHRDDHVSKRGAGAFHQLAGRRAVRPTVRGRRAHGHRAGSCGVAVPAASSRKVRSHLTRKAPSGVQA